MKTSTNKNKVNSLFTNYLIKISLLIFVLNTSITLAQSSSCNLDLKVNQNRNTRNAPPEGTYYSMVLTNNGKNSDAVSLSSKDANATCSNTDGSSSKTNVILNIEFLDKNLKPITEIKANSGETINFFAHILVPKGTQFDTWSCTEIIAKSNTCTNYKADTILHTLVIKPTEDN